VTRQLIREQVPDFTTRPEWATQRYSATERGRGTTRRNSERHPGRHLQRVRTDRADQGSAEIRLLKFGR